MSNKNQTILNLVKKHDADFNEFFKELGLKPNQRELLRAFMKISQGNIEFEASRLELAKLLFADSSVSSKVLKQRIRDWFRVLQKWQDKNRLEIIRLVEKGSRKATDDGKFDYYKTKYKFIFLEELTQFLDSDSKDFEEGLKKALVAIKVKYQPSAEPMKFHAKHNRRKAEKTIFTLLRNIFDYSAEVGDNPVKHCEFVLNKAQVKLKEMEREWQEKNNRQSIISEFENLLAEVESEAKEKADINCKSSDSYRAEIYPVITTGITRRTTSY